MQNIFNKKFFRLPVARLFLGKGSTIFAVILILLSSFLLFQIQPLLGKIILPWFGGANQVWSTSLLFFQIWLTAGYAYSNWLLKKSRRVQVQIHLILLLVSGCLLIWHAVIWQTPISPEFGAGFGATDQPVAAILTILMQAVGLPYFLLAANSSLIQAWFLQQHPDRSPYWLYAVSNIGALAGLLSYPFGVEPGLNLKLQGWFWSGGYFMFGGLLSGWISRLDWAKTGFVADPASDLAQTSPKIQLKTYLLWVGWAALASAMLLATTSQLTQEIAAVPFLWVLPLTVYLLSFVITFSARRFYWRWFMVAVLFFSTGAYLWFVVSSLSGILVQLGIYLLILWAFTMIAHGELYLLRPPANHLAQFYLWVSVGGALGGVLINFAAPLLFATYWEFQLGLALMWGAILVLALRLPYTLSYDLRRAVIGAVAVMVLLVIVSMYIQANTFQANLLDARRNFYGVIQVREKFPNDPEQNLIVMTHGVTTHGYQYTHATRLRQPTAYYVEESGVGLVFRYHPARPAALKVGMVGLGAGVLATYGQPGDEFIFYEINPAVAEIAGGSNFSFLRDSAAQVEVVLGDGRISLKTQWEESGAQDFDLLVLDAFSSDSIPTHLLTIEAVELYLAHLAQDGILAFHISNNHLDLSPVLWQIAQHLEIGGLEIYDPGENPRAKPSLWILLSSNSDFIHHPEIQSRSREPEPINPQLRLWTDDYSNLFQILK